ncbi:pimeloyl-ACP methyl ester carboxylesterase [Inhella inkyongensis]|uniref:Pimeloyl-ACP methyl ester carboxylesterase n=1 Tax=Inhella inkyongensis TaxID=392593 RepID=A0A840S6H6_9BURK|nr:alpha/beta hydrolase [Inhella inkyongensis]MBB5204079.1 pimeloyl-ACP methyl ester carboxylesterase [Inhella inkyongensis]
MKPTLVFAHANSYPAACYRRLFAHWQAAGYRVLALPQFGHHPDHPVDRNWQSLVDELLAFMTAELDPDAPRILVGHSLGGLLSLMAAARRHQAVQAVQGVLMLDSPYVSGWRATLLRLAQLSGRTQRQPPASVARQRRAHWPDTDALQAHFSAKPLFQAWHPEVLQDYLHHGFEPDPQRGGLRLVFRPEVEAQIYATVPAELPRLTAALTRPMAFIAGQHSREMRMGGIQATRRRVGALYREIEGSHLFPFEHPDRTAALSLELLRALSEAGGPDRRPG